ncbi:MAG: FkbM family methyltransferase [Gemmatimonadaceae bacterium]|nr:FkbM family methyltransferase [Gemmatimonadaceae bacterium]
MSPMEELEQLLSETEASASARAARAFDERAGVGARTIVLYGAGNLGQRIVARLRALGFTIVAFADGDRAKWGNAIEGIPVLSPADAGARYGADYPCVMSIWGGGTERLAARRAMLAAHGFARVVHVGHLFWQFAETFLPYYAMDLPQHVLAARDEIRRAYAVFGDDASRAEFVAQLRWRLHFDFDGLPLPVEHDVYFAPDLFTLRSDERFVDCGAYDGDTLRVLFARTEGKVGAVIAFEPDHISRERLLAWRATLPPALAAQVDVRSDATGATAGSITFASSGTPASAGGTGDETVPVVTLDAALTDFAPTFIKMDIEGAEYDTIAGARETIRRERPILTVCTYHVQNDLWRIPLVLAAAAPDYRFALRPHLPEVWELVTYAIPPERAHG